MFSFVQNFFAPHANPIGVDFGSDCLRLAQVQRAGGAGEFKLIAAASAEVPQYIRQNPEARIEFFIQTTRELLAQGGFKSRQAILALPAAAMHIQHLRMPKMDEEQTKKSLPWEARGKLPIDPSRALLRHLIAGEVYADQDPKNEVIVMAAAREFIDQLLAAASKAKLDVVGMNVEPKALIDCFSQVYRRKTDSEVTNCFIDIGCGSTRAIIARGQQIFFARAIPVGGDHFTRAVAQEMACGFEEAKMLRIRQCANAPALDESREKQLVCEAPAPDDHPTKEAGDHHAVLNAYIRKNQNAEVASDGVEAINRINTSFVDGTSATLDARIEKACGKSLSDLINELDHCRRYYEATFPNKPVDRLIFVGGEARQRSLCQQIARELGVAAQLGDPLVRMGRISEIPIESGIDRRQPQPSWAVAIGLSLGPIDNTVAANASAEKSRTEV